MICRICGDEIGDIYVDGELADYWDICLDCFDSKRKDVCANSDVSNMVYPKYGVFER